MPIITPAFPSMCSTHTITHSTKDTLLKEFKRAEELLASIQNGKLAWADLFSPHTFFTEDHKYYLSVIAASRTKEARDVFSGLVSSKVRLLVKGIDDGVPGIDFARPFPAEFDRVHHCDNEDQVERVTQGVLDFVVKPEDTKASADETTDGESAKTPAHTIYTTTFYIGLTLPEGIYIPTISILLF